MSALADIIDDLRERGLLDRVTHVVAGDASVALEPPVRDTTPAPVDPDKLAAARAQEYVALQYGDEG